MIFGPPAGPRQPVPLAAAAPLGPARRDRPRRPRPRGRRAHRCRVVLRPLPPLSILRDLWVDIPGNVPGISGMNRINATVDSGPDLLIETTEHDLGIPVNHYAAVDVAGFPAMVDALGGITLSFPDPVKDASSGLDVTRIQRQDAFFRALLAKADASLADPLAMNAFIAAAVKNLTIDDHRPPYRDAADRRLHHRRRRRRPRRGPALRREGDRRVRRPRLVAVTGAVAVTGEPGVTALLDHHDHHRGVGPAVGGDRPGAERVGGERAGRAGRGGAPGRRVRRRHGRRRRRLRVHPLPEPWNPTTCTA
jgi:hypothetical protein